MCLGGDIFGFIFFLDSLFFLDLDVCFLCQIRDTFIYYFSNKFSAPFALSSSRDPKKGNVSALMLAYRSVKLSLTLVVIFSFFFFSVWVTFTTLFSRSLLCSSISVICCLFPIAYFYFCYSSPLIGTSLYFIFVEILSVFIHFSSEFDEQFDGHYFGLSLG